MIMETLNIEIEDDKWELSDDYKAYRKDGGKLNPPMWNCRIEEMARERKVEAEMTEEERSKTYEELIIT